MEHVAPDAAYPVEHTGTPPMSEKFLDWLDRDAGCDRFPNGLCSW
jgi:hypothetical protein